MALLKAQQVNHGEMLPSTETNVLQLNTDRTVANELQKWLTAKQRHEERREKHVLPQLCSLCVDEDNQNENYLK